MACALILWLWCSFFFLMVLQKWLLLFIAIAVVDHITVFLHISSSFECSWSDLLGQSMVSDQFKVSTPSCFKYSSLKVEKVLFGNILLSLTNLEFDFFLI